jgi:hypothetical protein
MRRFLNGVWGLGIYVNPDPLRYVALQVGPLWIYLWREGGTNG